MSSETSDVQDYNVQPAESENRCKDSLQNANQRGLNRQTDLKVQSLWISSFKFVPTALQKKPVCGAAVNPRSTGSNDRKREDEEEEEELRQLLDAPPESRFSHGSAPQSDLLLLLLLLLLLQIKLIKVMKPLRICSFSFLRFFSPTHESHVSWISVPSPRVSDWDVSRFLTDFLLSSSGSSSGFRRAVTQ
ncbi:hypothetical protein Q8A73_020839 [Channa argus]|nr:hypothetical protein Q8A73_020839 [Channa argus]